MSEYKDYIFGNNVPQKAIFTTDGGIYGGLTNDQAFQLLCAVVAAEEGANIIADGLRRAAMLQGDVTPQYIGVPEAPLAVPVPRERIWVTRKFDAGDIVPRTITGGRQMLEITGPGKIVETILIADVNTIGMQIVLDGEVLYSGTYSEFLETTKADSNLSAYHDEGLSKYVLRVSKIGFENRFVFMATCTGTVTFDTIRVNYELLVEV